MEKFIRIGNRILNTDVVFWVKWFDEDSTVRCYTNVPNDDNPGQLQYYEFEGREATAVFAYFKGRATMVIDEAVDD